MTILEQIHEAESELLQAGIPGGRLDGEWLLAHVLNIPRFNLYLEPDRHLTPTQLSEFHQLLKRRANREPLQHLLGDVNFCGLTVRVNRRVLIPRPETEQLVELASEWIARHAPEGWALDMGTGSGCIALALSQFHPKLRLMASDLSKMAIQTAALNAREAGLSDRISFVTMDRLEAVIGENHLDLLISNPPYIATDELPDLIPEVRDHDPTLALDGGNLGMEFYVYLAKESSLHLKPGGCLFLEMGDDQAVPIQQLFCPTQWAFTQIHKDWNQVDRFFQAIKKGG